MFAGRERVDYGFYERSDRALEPVTVAGVKITDGGFVAIGFTTFRKTWFHGWKVDGPAMIEMAEGTRWNPYVLQRRADEVFRPGKKK